MERKLAAILATDVAGYSRLMGADEAGTFTRLRAHRQELFEPEIARHRGRVFKLMGDGLLAEFGSAADAVECAAALQRAMGKRNGGLPRDQRIDVRIGVHVGDVIVEDEDRHGDAGNVAARLQQLAEPGGICVSRPVVDHIRQRVALHFEPRGEERLKNIAEPVSVYRVLVDGKAGAEGDRKRVRRHGRWPWAVAAIIGVVLAAGASVWTLYPYGQNELPAAASATSSEPALAVLPFTNMSGDPALDYLGPGIAEDIITVLSAFPTLRVISRTSSFTYDEPVKVQEVGQELGAQYVIEGSVRKTADKVRVTVQLVDASTGDHLWADRFDETGEDPTILQEKVADRIYASLAGLSGAVRTYEQDSAWRKAAADLNEYDYFQRCKQLYFRFTPEDNAAARQMCQEGLSRFADSALLRIMLAWTYLEPTIEQWTKPSDPDIASAWRFGKEAEAVEDKSRLETWLSHWLMALLYQWHEEDFERSVVEAEATVQMAPYDGFSRTVLAGYLANAGKTDEAIEWTKEAFRRDPNGPEWWIGSLARAYYLGGRHEDALAVLQNMDEPPGDNLAAVYVRLGRLDEAQAIMAEFVNDTGYTVEDESRWPLKGPLKLAYLDDLRKAGMPEH